MFSNARSKLVTGAAVAAAAVGGATIANAASSGSSTSTTTTPQQQGPPPQGAKSRGAPPNGGRHTANGKTEEALSGDTASKVRAAALEKVKGTVERVETNVDSSAPYEAHIRKSDGTEVEVQVSKDFTVAAVNQMGQMPGQP